MDNSYSVVRMETITESFAKKMDLITNRGVEFNSENCKCHELISVLFNEIENLREENKRIIELENSVIQLQDQNERLSKENSNLKRFHDDIVFMKIENEQFKSEKSDEEENSDYLLCMKEQLKISTNDFVKENQEKKKLQTKVADLENKLLKLKIKAKVWKKSANQSTDKKLEQLENDKNTINRNSLNGSIEKILELVDVGHPVISDKQEYLECPSCHKSFSISNHLDFLDHIDICYEKN